MIIPEELIDHLEHEINIGNVDKKVQNLILIISEENQQLKETIIKAIELIKKCVELQLKEDYLMNRANLMNYNCNLLNILESSDNN